VEEIMSETHNTNVKSLYELLSIIDAKASALLSFNALLLAAISVWLNYVPDNLLHFRLDLAFLASLASCVFLLSIIWLHWSEPSGTADLQVRRTSRTKRYRISWCLSIVAVSVVSLVSIVHTVGTGLKAFGGCKSDPCAYFYSEMIFGNLDRSR